MEFGAQTTINSSLLFGEVLNSSVSLQFFNSKNISKLKVNLFVENQRLPPKSFPNQDIVECFAKDYMFLGCIKFIFKVKNGPFAEHSNQLWNISGVATWSKVNSGLIKMYKAEVLAKHPVMQHVLFGSLLPITEAIPQKQ